MTSDDELRQLAEAARDARAAYLDAPSFDAEIDAEYAWHNAVSKLKRHVTHGQIIDMLDRLRDAEAGWQPIATAPQDQWVLVYAAPAYGLDGFICTARYHSDGGWCVDELRAATHWRALPTPPEPTP